MAIPLISHTEEKVDLFVVDEIGKMEMFSTKFVDRMKQISASSDVPCLATVSQKGTGFIQDVKKSGKLFNLTKSNRDDMVDVILAEIEKLLPPAPK
jgi:nucleoside-triphosphatase